MVKNLLRILSILLVAVLVAGVIYLLTVNGIFGLGGEGFARGGALLRSTGGLGFQDRGGLEGQTGFSLNGLGGVAVAAGKIALITLLVVIVKSIASLSKRRRSQASTASAGPRSR